MRWQSVSAASATMLALLCAAPASAQNRPPAPAVTPYKAVAVTVPVPLKDASLDAFRNQLAEAARTKDRAAIAAMVVARGFFWDRDSGNAADKKKSGIDILAAALGLNNRDGAGWDMIASFADDPTVSAAPNHKGALCAPADPGFNGKEFEALLNATQSDVIEWSYPLNAGLEVRATPQSGAAVVDKLGLYFVRVVPDNSPAGAVASLVRVVTPSGKAGYVPADSIAPLGNDQICYIKDGTAWKVGGYIGGGDAQ